MTLRSLETARLVGCNPTAATSAELEALFDPEAVRWLPPAFHDLDDDKARRARLRDLAEEAELAGLRIKGGALVGLVVLTHPNRETPERHLGYVFCQQVWGQGLATEMLHGVVDLMRQTATPMLAGVAPENPASVHVLQKVGFEEIDTSGSENTERMFRWLPEH